MSLRIKLNDIGDKIMIFNVDYRDVELYTSATYGFKGLFDEDGKESWESKTMTDEDFKEAYEWSKDYLDKAFNSKTLEELRKNIRPNIPYYIELNDNKIIFNWSCPNRIHGEYHFGFNIIYANIS